MTIKDEIRLKTNKKNKKNEHSQQKNKNLLKKPKKIPLKGL